MIQTIHPFPARMAPEFALATLRELSEGSTVLDPMAGSGTVLRQASDLGHKSVGFDMDPLAILMSRVWTTPVFDEEIERVGKRVIDRAREVAEADVALPWIDDDPETASFIEYWFGTLQRAALRSLAFALNELRDQDLVDKEAAAADVLRLNLSRIIVTKEMCASLARDTSHSRPHRVAETSDYDVFKGFERSLGTLRKRLIASPPRGNATVSMGDVRKLDSLEDESIDAVLTSPPYLNAIDYLRGHRLSLVWLGHSIPSLRSIRSASIGAERSPDSGRDAEARLKIKEAFGELDLLPMRHRGMIERYAEDLRGMLAEISRVTRRGGRATFVVGNSRLKGTFIRNAEGVRVAALSAGFQLLESFERELPARNRYLPLTEGSLSKRMSTETILTFERVAQDAGR